MNDMRRQIRAALDTALTYQPHGGTDRERQAWRNGAREVADEIAEALTGETISADPESARSEPGGAS